MQANESKPRVKKVVASVLGISEADIAADANFIFDLGADSQQSVALVAALEIEFGIKIDKIKALSIQTVSEAVEFVAAAVK
jgi:acyl carrier protein